MSEKDTNPYSKIPRSELQRRLKNNHLLTSFLLITGCIVSTLFACTITKVNTQGQAILLPVIIMHNTAFLNAMLRISDENGQIKDILYKSE